MEEREETADAAGVVGDGAVADSIVVVEGASVEDGSWVERPNIFDRNLVNIPITDITPCSSWSPSRVTLAKCPACDAPLLATQYNMFGDGWDKPVRIFPARDREFNGSVPHDIARAFTKVRTCFRAKAYTAAAIMCRKTLEGICSVHGVKSSGRLADQLKKLKESGTIESSLFEWAEELRTIGNEAAHGVESVISPEDAHDTLEFTEALIEYVFTYRR